MGCLGHELLEWKRKGIFKIRDERKRESENESLRHVLENVCLFPVVK